jgi:hypothetical protein
MACLPLGLSLLAYSPFQGKQTFQFCKDAADATGFEKNRELTDDTLVYLQACRKDRLFSALVQFHKIFG